MSRARSALPTIAVLAARKAAERRLRRHCARGGILALTYDDGPGRRLTPRLLDVLAEYEAKATFYALGQRALEAPDVVDRIVGAGHELACHGFAHVNAVAASRAVAEEDIEMGYAALAGWLPDGGAFRPPYGKLTGTTARELRRRGAALGWWTVDSEDSLLAEPDLDRVVHRVERAGGGVVLLHDFDRGAGHEARENFTVAVTTALLDAARRRGWHVTTQGALR